MKYLKITIVFSIILSVIFSCNFSRNDGLKVIDKDDFRGIEDLYLVGLVYSTQHVINKLHGYHGRGIIRVNVIKSNINEYDPRNQQANYYCIIKKGKAEIYAHPGWLKKGDTIILDVKKKKLGYHHSNGKVTHTLNIWIGPASFFDFIKKKRYQKL